MIEYLNLKYTMKKQNTKLFISEIYLSLKPKSFSSLYYFFFIFSLIFIQSIKLYAQNPLYPHDRPTFFGIDETEVILYIPHGQFNLANANIKVWSREIGLIQHTTQISSAGNYGASILHIIPNSNFIAGDEIMISVSNIAYWGSGSNGDPYEPVNFTAVAPIENLTSAIFDTIGLGINLPPDARNFDYNFSSADFNNDGLSDIVYCYSTAYHNPTNILIFTQNGSGTFTQTTYINSAIRPSIDATPDLNNDGFPDLVVSQHQPDGLQIRLNNGNGTFGIEKYYYAPTNNYTNVNDIDNDGDLDIVTQGFINKSISIFKNNGDGTFQPKITISNTDNGGGLELSDLDKDGDQDIVYSGNYSLSLYENDGQANFTLSNVQSNLPFATRINSAIDLNDDSYPDLGFVTHNTNDLNIIYGDGNITNYSSSNFINVNTGNYMAGDLDGPM